jgi:hypothetical protein
VSLERGPLGLVSTTDELLGRKSSGSGLETREYGQRDPSRIPGGNLYPQKLALTSPTRGGRSVGTEVFMCSKLLTVLARSEFGFADSDHAQNLLVFVFLDFTMSYIKLKCIHPSQNLSHMLTELSNPTEKAHPGATVTELLNKLPATYFYCNPILFSICTSTFSNCVYIYTVACRRVSSSTPL